MHLQERKIVTDTHPSGDLCASLRSFACAGRLLLRRPGARDAGRRGLASRGFDQAGTRCRGTRLSRKRAAHAGRDVDARGRGQPAGAAGDFEVSPSRRWRREPRTILAGALYASNPLNTRMHAQRRALDFASSTLAIGVNMPARHVTLCSMHKERRHQEPGTTLAGAWLLSVSTTRKPPRASWLKSCTHHHARGPNWNRAHA